MRVSSLFSLSALRLSLLAVSLAAVTACQWGSATFLGDLGGGRGFDVNGTAFTYSDGHDDDLVEDDRPRVVAFMTWIIFDPNGDLNDADGVELERMQHELRLRDAAALIWEDQVDIGAGDEFESVQEGGVETGNDGLTAQIHLAPERVTWVSTYDSFQPLASKQTVSVTVDSASFAAGIQSGIAGSMTLKYDTTDDDPADAWTGEVQGRFNAPLVNERAAESNLSLLGVSDILGVPLPANGDGDGDGDE